MKFARTAQKGEHWEKEYSSFLRYIHDDEDREHEPEGHRALHGGDGTKQGPRWVRRDMAYYAEGFQAAAQAHREGMIIERKRPNIRYSCVFSSLFG